MNQQVVEKIKQEITKVEKTLKEWKEEAKTTSDSLSIICDPLIVCAYHRGVRDAYNDVLKILDVEREIGGEKMVKVKIVCHSCDGKGKIAEKEHPSRKQIMTVCPECNGDGWVWTEK